MAKRNPAQPKVARERASRGPAQTAADSTLPPVIFESAPTTPAQLPDVPEPGDIVDQALRSESMASEPNEEDIRLRAYHRYLERGGQHGRHFDDWVAAEQELKGKSQKSEVRSQKSEV
jgi:hypothetical protein